MYLIMLNAQLLKSIFHIKFIRNVGKPSYADSKKANLFLIQDPFAWGSSSIKLDFWTPACVIIKMHAIEPYTISLICSGVSLTKECAGEDFSCCLV